MRGAEFTGPRRELIERTFQRLSDATMRVVGWILLIAPPRRPGPDLWTGAEHRGQCAQPLDRVRLDHLGTPVALTALFYPVTAALGGISLREFARAVAPAQLVAASTRSSLAALPALVEAGRDRLGLPVAATGFVIPFAVATVKVSRTISATIMLLFLAHAFELPLGPDRIILFAGTILLLSFMVAGLPVRGPEASVLPAYIVAGMPLEGVLILETVDSILDIFKTILNVTSTMSVAAIVAPRSRSSGSA